MQSRLESLHEAVHNTWIGFLLSMTIQQFLVTPLTSFTYGCHFSVAFNFGITTLFTIVSVGRNYLIRRWNVYKLRTGVTSVWDFCRKLNTKGTL